MAQRASGILRQLEPAVAGIIAAVTAWLAATSHTDLPALWLFCAFALAVALWAGLRRPVGQVETAARALALLAAGYLLHTHAGAPGGAAVWASEDALSLLAAGGAYLLILPMLLALGLGALSRRRSARADDGCRDRSTALYNRSGLLAQGRELLARCRAERRELTLAVFDCGDLVEARAVYGNRTTRALVDRIVAKLTLLAGSEGLAARTGPTQFAVALPMSHEKAVQAIGRVLGNPGRFEIEGCKSEIVLVPHLMVEAVPAAGTVDRMFSALCRGLARVQEQERMRQRYLQRERERHSRPMAIQPAVTEAAPVRTSRVPLLGPDPVVAHQIPSTIPMPLAAS